MYLTAHFSFSGRREQITNALLATEKVVGFVSCVTALAPTKAQLAKKRKRGEEEEEEEDGEMRAVQGLVYWIMTDSTEDILQFMEAKICNLFMEAGLDITHCRVLTPNSKKLSLLLYLRLYAIGTVQKVCQHVVANNLDNLGREGQQTRLWN